MPRNCPDFKVAFGQLNYQLQLVNTQTIKKKTSNTKDLNQKNKIVRAKAALSIL